MNHFIIRCKILIKFMLLLGAGISLVALANSPSSNQDAAISSPVKTLQATSNAMIAMIKQTRQELLSTHKISANAPLPLEYTTKIIQTVLMPHVDLEYVSQSCLGPLVWHKASLTQRTHFQAAFKTLLINTYAAVLADYHDQKIQFFKLRTGYHDLQQVQVKSKILQIQGNDVEVNYRMLLNKSTKQWYVIDISISGISVVESFRSQFSSELNQGGLVQLLATLDKHNATMGTQVNSGYS